MINFLKKQLKSNRGFTLAEVLVALALISLIVMGFIGLFVFSARTNSMSTTSMTATYIARDNVEMLYDLSRTEDFSTAIEILTTDHHYTSLSTDKKLYGKLLEQKYITIEFETLGNLIKVLVIVYEDDYLQKKEAQIETILSWD
ncbi:type IV pilus modification PilV family protein [Alkaliphilus transvaalensis]|uniref:type IV pilus modification PilV family protein n=1 Tax=Alkaliphilus transvaalensis TaxID=114628 RepID=UPI000479DF5E|nr:prepilin-type N-terminal cleavage/methylation domain-containing protein [Alkaliphilus transvaalensis]